MTTKREVKESRKKQGADEQISYTLETTPWGSTPSNVAVKLYSFDGSDYTDVSDTLLSGAAAVNGDIITTPIVTGLTAGTVYRLEIKFTVSGNVEEAYCWIDAER